MRAVLDLVAPTRCVSCGRMSDGELCGVCAGDVVVLGSPLCDRCGAPTARPTARCSSCASLGAFTRARSVVVFAEPARRLTLDLKRRGRAALARSVGGLLGELAVVHGLVTSASVVTFVPSGKRARGLGFDHAELIARATARRLGRPARRLLVRAREGPRQADVPFAQRRVNVEGRFAARGVSGHVLLVDDVFTTGATTAACADALLRAGASGVDVVTWARTLRRNP